MSIIPSSICEGAFELNNYFASSGCLQGNLT